MKLTSSICINEINPSGGMQSSHGPLCAFECGEAATKHVRIGGWCGNLCDTKPCNQRAAGGTFTARPMGMEETA